MPHPHSRRRNDGALEADLLGRARRVGKTVAPPTVETKVSIADARAAELHARQIAAIVRLLRQAVELRRAA